MFAEAYTMAAQYTNPVIASRRHFDGAVHCAVGAFVTLNEDGWIVTAAHLFDSFVAFQQHRGLVEQHREESAAIERDTGLTGPQRQKKLRRVKGDPKWITHHSFWWGWDGVAIHDVQILSKADLAVGRLEPWKSTRVPTYPTIKDPAQSMELGRSLCKLGYPFHEIKATYHEDRDAFDLAPDALPIPRFPIEGIYTRNARAGKTADGRYEVKFLETSSPGLRGQSGGPVFDAKGTVWGIQSRTAHLPLGFSPKVRRGGREIEEHQFLSVGLAVHAEVIVAFLRDQGIQFQLSEY